MFVGHAFIAFALVTLVVRRYGPADRPLRLPGGVTVESAFAAGLAAALFASLPDVDVVHAAFQVVTLPEGSTAFDHFWAATSERHRTATHSLLIAVFGSAGFALWRVRRVMSATVLLGVVVATVLTGGPVGGAVMVLFVAGGLLVATLAARTGLAVRTVFGASTLGLAVHPFTDLLTGQPPDFFAPWSVVPIASRVEPFADATLNLLVAFGTEIAVIWLGLLVATRTLDIDPRRHIHYTALLGVVYGPMAFVLEAPSVDAAVPFVGTILHVGLVGGLTLRRPWRTTSIVTFVLTGLAAITVAWLAFTGVYVVAVL